MEQGDPEALLEPRDGLAHGGGRHTQDSRGAHES